MQPSLLSRLRGRREITFAVLAVAASSFALLQSLIVPVLATIQVEFDTSQTTVTWVLTAYLLSASICTPLLGRIGDVVGKVRMLVIALVVLSLGSLAAALAPSIGWLIAARALQGVGGGVLPLSFGIIRDEFRGRMTMALSVIASLTAVGFGVGIVVAGPIVDTFGYQGLFWLPMVVTLVAAAAALLFVPESPVRTPARLPVGPALLLAGWLVALLIALSEGNQWGWTSAPDPRPVRDRGGAGRRVGRGRAPGAGPDDRHAHDAAPRRVDLQRGRRLRRLRHVRVVRVPATAAADPARGRLRLRRLDHRVRLPAAALGGGQLPGRVRHRRA